jgi:hypothetical protein
LDGSILTVEQSKMLQLEIEKNYNEIGIPKFGHQNNDIRTQLFNFDNPYIYIEFNDFVLRAVEGLIEGEPYSGERRRTYLLYADNQIIAKFYKLADVRIAVKNIKIFIYKNNILSD